MVMLQILGLNVPFSIFQADCNMHLAVRSLKNISSPFSCPCIFLFLWFLPFFIQNPLVRAYTLTNLLAASRVLNTFPTWGTFVFSISSGVGNIYSSYFETLSSSSSSESPLLLPMFSRAFSQESASYTFFSKQHEQWKTESLYFLSITFMKLQ